MTSYKATRNLLMDILSIEKTFFLMDRKDVDTLIKRPTDVRYEVYNYRDSVLANENNLKEKADYTAYKDNTPEPMSKFKFRKEMIEGFKNELMVKCIATA